MTAFDQALAFVLEWEGGLVSDPNDAGGLTNHGISQRAYPDLAIAALTRDDVVAIYARDYWAPVRGDELPAPLALVMFDSAVNQGVSRAVICMQRALGVADDGIPGPATMEAGQRAWTRSPAKLLREVCVQRQLHYAVIPGWRHYREGWTRRLFAAHGRAVDMLGR